MTHRLTASGLLLSLLMTGSAMAADPAAQGSATSASQAVQASPAKVDEAAPHPDSRKIGTLKIFLDQGAKVDYLGRQFGLDGWLVSKDSAIQVVYTTADGQGTVVGLLYGPDGQVVTGNQLLKAKENGLVLPNVTGVDPAASMQTGILPTVTPPMSAPSTLSPSERLWKEMEGSTYLTFGPDTAPPLYVFMDPRCHYCHDYFQNLSTTFLPKNSIQLRVVPVGILGPDSLKEAQQILSASDPKTAWDKLEAGDKSGLPDIKPGTDAKVSANNDLMGQWSLKGTPGTVYRGKDGKVKLVYGLPSDIAAMVGDVTK